MTKEEREALVERVLALFPTPFRTDEQSIFRLVVQVFAMGFIESVVDRIENLERVQCDLAERVLKLEKGGPS